MTATLEQIEQRVQRLEGMMPKTAQRSALGGHVHPGGFLNRAASSGAVPDKSLQPGLWVVPGTPPELWLVDENGQVQLGYSAEAVCSGDVTLTTVDWTDVTGCSITVPNAGAYIVVGTINYDRVSGTSTIIRGRLLVDGSAQTGQIEDTEPDVSSHTSAQSWSITTAAADEVVKLQAQRSAGTGNHVINATHSKIVIFGLGLSF